MRNFDVTPGRLVDQLRTWFHPKDRSVVLPDGYFVGLGLGKGRIQFDDLDIDLVSLFDCDFDVEGHSAFGNAAAVSAHRVVLVDEDITGLTTFEEGARIDLGVTLDANSVFSVIGGRFIASLDNAGFAANNVQGINTIANVDGAGTTEEMYGIVSASFNSGSGTVGLGISLYAGAITNTGGGAITTVFGLFVVNQTAGGTNWSIYSQGGNSYHADDFGIGSTAVPTAGSGAVLFMGDNAGDPTMGVNTAGFYGKDVGGTVEAFAIDEAGNAAQLTSHNFTLFEPDDSYGYPFSFYAKNRFVGEVNVDLYGAIREIEAMTGKQFIYERLLASAPDWAAWQREEKVREEARLLEMALIAKHEVLVKDALELIPESVAMPTGAFEDKPTGRFVLNKVTGRVEAEQKRVPVTKPKPTGRMVWQPKARVRFDEVEGKFYRKLTEDEVVVKPYTPKDPPAWLAKRMPNG